MALTISAFEGLVRDVLNEGTTADAVISSATRQVVRALENLHTFLYMESRETFDLPPAVSATALAPAVDLLADLKEVFSARVYDPVSPLERWSFEQVSVRDFVIPPVGSPRNYTMLDERTIQPVETWETTTFKAEIHLSRFTVWPTDKNQGHWLLDNAEGYMLNAVVLEVLPFARNPELAQLVAPLVQSKLPAVISADETLRQSNRIIQVNAPGQEV